MTLIYCESDSVFLLSLIVVFTFSLSAFRLRLIRCVSIESDQGFYFKSDRCVYIESD